MPYIADSYLRASAALDEIKTDVTQWINRRERAVQLLQEVETALGALSQAHPAGWLETVQFINQQAAANPGDEAWQRIKAETDKIVADFQAELAKTQAINAAVAAL
jgi:hypothetical protein